MVLYVACRRPGMPALVLRIQDGIVAELDMRLDLWAHSHTGLEWGYGGSGPAQLALALLADALENDALAIALHQRFKREFVASMKEGWWVSSRENVIRCALELVIEDSREVIDLTLGGGATNDG